MLWKTEKVEQGKGRSGVLGVGACTIKEGDQSKMMMFEQRLGVVQGRAWEAEGTANAKVLDWEACLLHWTNRTGG